MATTPDFEKDTQVIRKWLNHQGVPSKALADELALWLTHVANGHFDLNVTVTERK